MTLSTDVYILDEVDTAEVFRFCQGLLAQYDVQQRSADQQRWSEKQDTSYTGTPGVWEVRPGNPWSRDNEVGQRLPAWLMSAYRPDGPLRTAEQAAEHDEDCEPDCDGSDHYHRACYMSLDFDAAYSYRTADGWDCGDLRAALVGQLGAWLDAKGVRWEWRNEFTGEVHSGHDGLDELGRAGAEAARWFATQALPAILVHEATGGAS